MQHIVKLGEITVTVDAPDEIAHLLTDPSLFVRPATREEFDAVVQAAGGPDAFCRPGHDVVWSQAVSDEDPRKLIGLYPPEADRHVAPPVYPKPPAMQQLQDAQEMTS